jgi:hypothetical protein
MKKLTTIIAGALCVCMMTAQAALVSTSFNSNFGVPNLGSNKSYGSKATVTNTPVTAADGIATFQLTYDISLVSGADIESLANHAKWGVGNTLLDPAESARIENIQVVNFLANGGSMTIGDISGLSFKDVGVNSAQHAGDIAIIAANGITNTWTNANANVPQFDGHTASKFDLHLMTASENVPSFYVECVAGTHRYTEVTVFGYSEFFETPSEPITEAWGFPKVASDVDYGTNPSITSGVIVATDGLADFKLAYDITSALTVKSRQNTTAWGVANSSMNAGESALIDNLRVVDFNANGGSFTIGDITHLSFKQVKYQAATVAADSGSITANGNGVTNTWTDINAADDFIGHLSDSSSVDVLVMTGDPVV